MSQGSSSTGASACRQQCQRNDSCLCQGDKPAVPTGVSVPAFSTFMPQVQNKLFPSPEEGLAPAPWYLPEGSTAYPPGQAHRAANASQKGCMFWQGWCSALADSSSTHIHSSRCPRHRRVSYFSGTLQKGTIQQHVLGHLPTQPKSCPASLRSSAPHPPAPPHATGSTQDHFTSAERTSPPLQIPHSLSLGAQFQAAIKQLSTEVNQNYTHFHQPQIWPNFAKNT